MREMQSLQGFDERSPRTRVPGCVQPYRSLKDICAFGMARTPYQSMLLSMGLRKTVRFLGNSLANCRDPHAHGAGRTAVQDASFPRELTKETREAQAVRDNLHATLVDLCSSPATTAE